MNFLRTAFWVIIAVALALFTKANWTVAPSVGGYIPIKLWGDIIVETRLPVLILAAFLLGLVPTWLWARAMKWQMRRKLSSTERALASSIALQQQSAATEEAPSTDVAPLPSDHPGPA
tara:strand:+ start:169741 stop:170094 length:354 start_codon:yes stop_codon:yes gene_type:complete